MTSYAVRHGDAVRYMSVPAGAFAARHADSPGHRPQKHLDLRKHARTPALRLGQRRIIEAEALPCRGRNDATAASLRVPQRAGTYDLPGPSQDAWPNSFQASYGNTVSSPVIVKLVEPHASLTGQAGVVLAIFAVAALQAYVLAAATIDRIARKLLQADGFVAMAAAFACL
jgi:PHS family inorganic phosphate transporter-like MFS transporter